MGQKKALNGSHLEVFLAPQHNTEHDFDLSISNVFLTFVQLLQEIKKKQKRGYAFKFQIRLKAFLEKFSFENNKLIKIEAWFPSNTYTVLDSIHIRKKINTAIRDIYKRYDSFVQRGSGWVLKKVSKFSVSIMKFKLFQGGCLSALLPRELHKKRCCVSIKNIPKNKCFFYCVAAALCENTTKKNKYRKSNQHDKIIELLPFDNMEGPVSIREIKYLEKNSCVSVNVYGYDKIPYPYYISEFVKKLYHVDVLLHNNHYYLIRNMSTFASGEKSNRRKCYVCQYCLCYFVKKERYDLHVELCVKGGHQYEFPHKDAAQLNFSNYSNIVPASFVMYCDLEAMITKEVKVNRGKIQTKSVHVPVAVGAITVCRPKKEFGSLPMIYTGADCIDVLLQFIQSEVSRVSNILKNVCVPCVMRPEDKYMHKHAKHCFMCRKKFSDFRHLDKVRDHCHLSGKFRYTLCSTCNLTRAKRPPEIHLFFHGLSNYDSHFIIQKLYNFSSTEIKIIPKNTEKYLSFSVGCVHFKDSYQFLSESLAILVQNLMDKGPDHFVYVNKFIKDDEQRELLKQKGIFPYNYMKDVRVLRKKHLPKKEEFFNDLTCQHITKDEYDFAQKVWDRFSCKTFQDYMEIYLLADCLLLCDVFENFRSNCLQQYNIDPCYYFSAPHFTFDAFLRHSSLTLELLSDINQYLFIIKGIRGGMSMVSKRHAVANNKYVEGYNSSKSSSFILYLDANNLYGRAMQEYLPWKNFEWMSPHQLNYDFIKRLEPEGEVGCIIQCSLEYPVALHDYHSDYPLAPIKKSIPYGMLSPVARMICDKHKLKRTTNVEKLLATVEDKDFYILHYRNLQLYVSLGLRVKKIHAGIIFKQGPIMKSYVDFNSEKRAQATNKFDTDFYKLLSNSLYGKTIENPEKRSKVKLCSESSTYENYVGKPNFKNAKRINSKLVGVEMKYSSIKINKPFYIGMSILDLSKWHMYNFHYNVMKAIFGDRVHLLYTDTDSFIYEISSADVYEELRPHARDYFDFSNYPENHMLKNSCNKKVPGKFKDESASKCITEFVGLRSKMYSFMFDDKKDVSKAEVRVAKGVQKSVIFNDLRFSTYLNCLWNDEVKEHNFKTIRSMKHSVATYTQSKITLCPFEDKRYLLDAINSVPYGHYVLGC